MVVAEKEVVYKKFSIPLINRLEKHFLNISSMLTRDQLTIVDELQQWAREQARFSNKASPEDMFVGYHVDAPASVVLQATRDLGSEILSNITPDIKENVC